MSTVNVLRRNSFIVFSALIAESQSHFERSKRVKGFTQEFLKCHRVIGALNFAESKGDRTTLCGLHFAVVSDKLAFNL